jgi:hypothetical protein
LFRQVEFELMEGKAMQCTKCGFELTKKNDFKTGKCRWCRTQEQIPPLWEGLSNHKKQSTRNQLHHFFMKLMLL